MKVFFRFQPLVRHFRLFLVGCGIQLVLLQPMLQPMLQPLLFLPLLLPVLIATIITTITTITTTGGGGITITLTPLVFPRPLLQRLRLLILPLLLLLLCLPLFHRLSVQPPSFQLILQPQGSPQLFSLRSLHPSTQPLKTLLPSLPLIFQLSVL
jgi:hypothetical protein